MKSLHEHALGLASATNIDEIVKYTLDTIQFTLGFDCADFNLVEDGMVVVKGTRGSGQRIIFSGRKRTEHRS